MKPLNEFHNAIEAMRLATEPISRFSESISAIKKLNEPLERFRESFSSISYGFTLIDDLRHSVKAISGFGELKSQLQQLQIQFPRIDSSIEVESSGEVSLSTTHIQAEDLQNLADQIVSRVIGDEKSDFTAVAGKISDEINKQSDPNLRNILIWFIYPILIGLIFLLVSPFYDNFINSYLKTDNKKLEKDLKIHVCSVISNTEQLNSIRYVSTNTLKVRSAKKVKSSVIGNLHFGYIVVILEKQRNWTLIEWKDPSSEVSIRGWVFTRYLEKFK